MAQKTTTEVKTNAVTKKKTVPDIPKDIRQSIKANLEQIEQNWFDVSILLSIVYHEELFKNWGYKDFVEYFTKELNLSYRLAMGRVQIGDCLRSCDIDRVQVAKIGWTKFKELTSLLKPNSTKEQVSAIIKKAEKMTYLDIANYVKQVRTETAVINRRTTLSFRLSNDQADIVEEALQTAEGLTMAQNSRDIALEYICIEWLMSHKAEPNEAIMSKISKSDIPKAPHKEHANKGKSKKKATKKATKKVKSKKKGA